jgi:hypothetical protein
MEKLFRLEFNEESQALHHNRGDVEPETNGYITVAESCSISEYYILKCYLLSRFGKELMTTDDVLKSRMEVEVFIMKLLNYGFSIHRESVLNQLDEQL